MLETDRLILRRIDPDRDFEAWASALADEEHVRYTVGRVQNRAEAWRSMAAVIGHWAIRGYGFFSVEDKASGAWVGRVGPWFPEGWPEPEIGWSIAPDCLRRGFATEAALASLRFAFDELGWKRVVHCILEGNEASIGVAHKIGSKFLYDLDGLAGITTARVLVYGQGEGC